MTVDGDDADERDMQRRLVALVARMECEEIAKRVGAWSLFIPHRPTQKQLIALERHNIELLFGGAAGGGKSDYLLMCALQYIDVPRYSALVLRRTFRDLALSGALMDRAAEWLRNTAARWDAQEKTWRFPSGATLAFGYLESDADKYRYQSAEYQCICFDELTQFTEPQYIYLFSRLRRLRGANVPLRMRSATNPDGDGIEWVRRRFVPDEYINSTDEKRFGQVWEFGGRVFVPARLEDNPHIDREAYRDALSRLDVVTQARLEAGDWLAEPTGNLISPAWFGNERFFPDLPSGAHWQWRAWDLALRDRQIVAGKRRALPDYHASVKGCVWHGDLWIGSPMLWRSDAADAEETIARVITSERDVLHGVGSALHESVVVQSLRRRGYAITQYPEHQGDKVSRASAWIRLAKSGRVKVVGTREQWRDFMFWWWRFPNGAYDDSVDAMSGLTQLAQLRFDETPKLAARPNYDVVTTRALNAVWIQ